MKKILFKILKGLAFYLFVYVPAICLFGVFLKCVVDAITACCRVKGDWHEKPAAIAGLGIILLIGYTIGKRLEARKASNQMTFEALQKRTDDLVRHRMPHD